MDDRAAQPERVQRHTYPQDRFGPRKSDTLCYQRVKAGYAPFGMRG